jgi:catecholate siderophore receptor
MINRSNRPAVSGRIRPALGAAAVAGLAGLALAPSAFAAESAPMASAGGDSPTELSGVEVTGEAGARPASPKYTAAPKDTPQTITILSKETLDDQNLLTLRDVLQTVPGITFGAGEGGGGYGDSINLRGYSANNDITTDGLRDSAQYSRTDTFNLQQIEVVNGANGVYSGSGGVGGNINLVSKTPGGTGRTIVSGGLGTEGYVRGTVDADYDLSPDIAVRINAMAHQNDVPGRDVERYERWGIAPSILFGQGGPTRLTILALHQEDENTPRYGVPYASNAFLNGPLPGVDPANYYGYANIDRQETSVDSVTLRFSHDFSEDLTITNTARWLRVTQLIVVNPPQGTWCLASGFNAQTGAACATPGVYNPSGPRGTLRDSENTQLVNQTDLNWRFATGPLKHNLVVGAAFSIETYDLSNGNVQRNPLGATPNPALPPMSIANPFHQYTGPVNRIITGRSDGELQNRAVYLFDNVEIGSMWAVNFGVRYEQNEGEFTTATIATPYPAPPAGPVVTQNPVARNEDSFVSWRVGVVFKPTDYASLYVAYANTNTPSQATVNGGCSTTGATQNCNLDPEKGELIEAGAKLSLLGDRLAISGSVFQNTRSNIRLNSNDPAIIVQQLDGESRVRGVTLSVSGQITPDWLVIANYTFLDSEILQNIASTALPPNNVDFTRGDPIPNTPEHGFSAWTTYQVNERWMIGAGATYSGEYAFQRPNATAPLMYADDYWLLSAAVTWRVTDRLELQLNVKNLTDEEYYTNIRSSNGFGWAVPGDARSAVLTANYRF